ncbi:hypothetical protein OKW45_000392 [Paraburkholderia sp. WSM4175]
MSLADHPPGPSFGSSPLPLRLADAHANLSATFA